MANNNDGGWSPGSIKPGGWLIILLILGVIYWYGIKPRLAGGSLLGSKIFGGKIFGGNGSGGGASGTGDNAGPAAASGVSSQDAQNGTILVSTSGTKQQWLAQEVEKFNGTGQGKATLASPVESRDAMQGIYNGKMEPTVWSPSSPVWTERLAQLKSGMIDESDPASYRVVFKSPLVFLTTKSRAAQLRPLLTGATPFTQIARGAGAHKVRFGYADPIAASSGMLTMALILSEYSRAHGGMDPTVAAGSRGFAAFLGQINHALVRSADNAGSSKLEQAYTHDPNSRDFITAYESAALAAIEANPQLTIIYPNPTTTADQGLAVLNAPWVTPAQKTTAQAFLSFVGKAASVNDGLAYGFRPSVGGVETLRQHLTDAQFSAFQSSYTSVELPPYEALNEAAAVYRGVTH